MKAEELMFRDWVHSKLHNVDTQIDCVGREPGWKSDFYCVWLTSKDCWERHYMDEIEPIPLTPEILEKNGFMNIEGDFYLRFGDYKIVFDKHNAPFVMKEYDSNGFLYEVPILEVTYIHELQHFLRLCGIKKEIVL